MPTERPLQLAPSRLAPRVLAQWNLVHRDSYSPDLNNGFWLTCFSSRNSLMCVGFCFFFLFCFGFFGCCFKSQCLGWNSWSLLTLTWPLNHAHSPPVTLCALSWAFSSLGCSWAQVGCLTRTLRLEVRLSPVSSAPYTAEAAVHRTFREHSLFLCVISD